MNKTKSGKKPQLKVAQEFPATSPSGRFRTQWIEPKGTAFLSQMFGPIYFVVKNHAANNVMVNARHAVLMDVSPGAVRATYAYGTITVENRGEKPALIEFEFLPIFVKP